MSQRRRRSRARPALDDADAPHRPLEAGLDGVGFRGEQTSACRTPAISAAPARAVRTTASAARPSQVTVAYRSPVHRGSSFSRARSAVGCPPTSGARPRSPAAPGVEARRDGHRPPSTRRRCIGPGAFGTDAITEPRERRPWLPRSSARRPTSTERVAGHLGTTEPDVALPVRTDCRDALPRRGRVA